MQKIDRFLRLMNDRGASDFHLTVGRPPMVRASGSMETIRYRMISEMDFTELLRHGIHVLLLVVAQGIEQSHRQHLARALVVVARLWQNERGGHQGRHNEQNCQQQHELR